MKAKKKNQNPTTEKFNYLHEKIKFSKLKTSEIDFRYDIYWMRLKRKRKNILIKVKNTTLKRNSKHKKNSATKSKGENKL